MYVLWSCQLINLPIKFKYQHQISTMLIILLIACASPYWTILNRNQRFVMAKGLWNFGISNGTLPVHFIYDLSIMEIIQTSRAGKKMCLNGFMYTFKYESKTKNEVTWRCVKRDASGCSAILRTSKQYEDAVLSKPHNHIAYLFMYNLLYHVSVYCNVLLICSCITCS